MYKQLSAIDLVLAVMNNLKANTNIEIYDEVPNNAPSPFYYVQLIGKRPVESKTMYIETCSVAIHCIAAVGNSNVGIYNMIQTLEEAMTIDIKLPADYNLLMQVSNGIQTIKTDETNEKHAVATYEFKVGYGLKCKI